MKKIIYILSIVTGLLLLLPGLSRGQAVNFDGLSTYTQDFQTMMATVLAPATISSTTMLDVSAQAGGLSANGWFLYHQATGTPRWGRSDGSSSTGSFFGMYDAQGTPNRALGSEGSASINAFFGIVLKNTSGGTINSVTFSYDAVINRNPSTTVNPYPLSYLVSSTAVSSVSGTGAGTFNDGAGTWTAGIGFTTPSTGIGAPGSQAAITPLFRIGGAAITQTLSGA